MALTVSTIVVVMVMTTFLAQNDFYNEVVRRSEVQETVRSATGVVLGQTRSVTPGGVVLADSLRMVVRVPLAMAAVCATQGNNTYVHLPVSPDEIDGNDVTGIGVRDDFGTWSYYDATWSSVLQNPTNAASRCSDEGADTEGAIDEFQRFRLVGVTTPPPTEGQVIMIYREEEFAFATSALDPETRALFRGPYGGTLTELATGMGPQAHFQYRLPDGSYATSVTGASLYGIDGIRVAAAGRSRPRSGGNTYDYDLTVGVPLRNSP